MKKQIIALCLVFVVLCAASSLYALAAETGNDGASETSNVTITVVLPEPTPALAEEPSPTAPAIAKVYPSDVTDIRDSNGWQIVKTYELNAAEKPEDIPRDPFERSGWKFTLTDIIRHETANAETREHTETVTLNTDTKELENILPLFSPSMEYKSDDGFIGIITLDVSSIKVETAGTRTSSYTMSVTREYPRLSTNDTSLVPKTVTDRGTTYTLAGVDWRAGNYVTVDYEQIPEYYTAIATYTATGTSTKVTGYVTTALYKGTLAKLSQGRTIYTAYFLGEEIRTPLEMVTPTPKPIAEPTPEATLEPAPKPTPEASETPEPTATPETPQASGEKSAHNNNALLAIITCLAILAGGAYYFIKRKVKHYAKTHNSDPGDADDGSDGGSGSGG